MIPKHYDSFVTEVRQSKGMSQEMLAEQTGVSVQTIRSVESAKYDLSLVLGLKIATALQEDVAYLFRLRA